MSKLCTHTPQAKQIRRQLEQLDPKPTFSSSQRSLCSLVAPLTSNSKQNGQFGGKEWQHRNGGKDTANPEYHPILTSSVEAGPQSAFLARWGGSR